MTKLFKLNYKNLIIFLILFIVEFLIAVFIHDKIIRPFVGDILIIILLYYLIKSFINIKTALLPLYLFIFTILVELTQFLNILKLLRIQNNKLLRILMGTTADIKDIICYFIGMIVLFLIQYFYQRKNK